MAIQSKTLSGSEHDYFATLSGLSANAPLSEHKAKVFSDAGCGGVNKPLSQMEREWIQKLSGSSKLNEGDLWRELVSSTGITPSVSTSENKFLFYSSAGAALSAYITSLPNLNLYYPLNETSGNAINRAPATIGTLNGTVANATRGQAGQAGLAYSFNGSSTKVTVAYAPNTAAANQSFFFLVTPTSVANTKQPWAWDDNSANQIGCFFNGTAKLAFTKWTGTSLVASLTTFQTGTPYLVVYTFNGTDQTMFINGVQDNTAAVAGNAGTPSSLKLGNWTGETNGWYAGLMQHFGHVKRVLTNDEILKMAQLAGLA